MRFPGHIYQISGRTFTLIKPSKYYNMGYKHMHCRLCRTLWIKLHKKEVKRQFLGFKDVTRFGSVIGILSYFSWQLNFSGASIKFQEIRISRSAFKFQEISRISRSWRHRGLLKIRPELDLAGFRNSNPTNQQLQPLLSVLVFEVNFSGITSGQIQLGQIPKVNFRNRWRRTFHSLRTLVLDQLTASKH